MKPSGALALLDIPFIFTQDDLLSTGEFVQEAERRGYTSHRVDDLQMDAIRDEVRSQGAEIPRTTSISS